MSREARSSTRGRDSIRSAHSSPAATALISRSPLLDNLNARGEAKAPPRAVLLCRELEDGLQVLRRLLELVAPDERQCRDDADCRDAGADDEGAGEPMH